MSNFERLEDVLRTISNDDQADAGWVNLAHQAGVFYRTLRADGHTVGEARVVLREFYTAMFISGQWANRHDG